MNYITGGNGFIGKVLSSKTGAINIPHEEIDSYELKDFDNFYFCSAYGNMSDHTDDKKIIKANLLDLITIINKIKDKKFKSFVYISTSSITLPIQTMYSRTKKAGEEICLAFIEKYNLPITIIRPYSVTGVGEQEKHLIPVLLNAAINDLPVMLCEGSHDFIDIDDLTNGIIKFSGNKGIHELGSGISTTNKEVLELVELVTQKRIVVNNVPQLRSYDNKDWVCKNPAIKVKKSLTNSIKEMYEQIKRDIENK